MSENMDRKKIAVALSGNPNSGKSTIFNQLTGARQSVGNYPGVTVEKKTGIRRHGVYDIALTDLPGTYGLTAWSLDEKVARDFIVGERPAVVVDVVDSSNLERSLYLTTQLLEMGVPLVLAFNMTDVADARGIEMDLSLLSDRFGAPVITLVGHRNQGMDQLLDAVVRVAENPGSRRRIRIDYGEHLEPAIARLVPLVEKDPSVVKEAGIISADAVSLRWMAIKLLEEDCDLTRAVRNPDLSAALAEELAALNMELGDRAAVLIADRRYGYISGVCQVAVRNTVENRQTISDKADVILTHSLFGLPIFLMVMYLVFNLTFTLGNAPMQWLESMFGWLGEAIRSAWPTGHLEWMRSLIVDGVIGGVGGVVVFLPNIMLLFLGIALLEYSGYMARAAFIMDHVMHRIGLHGKSFIPMMIGFGCSVPAILATRTLDSRRDRLITMLVVPLMSCGARLPIYALLIPAFFAPAWQTPMLWLIYVTGVVLAVVSAKVLGTFVFREKTEGLVIELPPYRVPTLRCVLTHMWERSWLYLRKAGTLILGISVLMWAMSSFPQKTDMPAGMSPEQQQSEQLAFSVAGRVGQWMVPVLKPMGFDWKIGTALIGAMAAKEVFVSQLAIVNSIGGDGGDRSESLRLALRREYTPLIGFCMMLFTLIGFPCVATVAAVRMESGQWKWALFQLGGLTLIAYILTVVVYQAGMILSK